MNEKQAYSKITIKSIDNEKRIIHGIASTPALDRDGDIVTPSGAKFTLPIPLLWQHDRSQPVGEVISAKVTDKGIEIVATIAKVDEPPRLKARLDEAWESLKAGLVRGLSIGFTAIKYSFLEENGGIQFDEWDFQELSLVTIPANQEASITAIKSAALGAKSTNKPALRLNKKTVKLKTNINGENMKLLEQIKEFQARLEELKTARQEIVKSAAKDRRTLEGEEIEQFDTLNEEIEQVKGHIARLNMLVEEDKTKAAPVDNKGDKDDPVNGKSSSARIQVLQPKAEKGVAFAQYARLIGIAKGNMFHAQQLAEQKKGSIDQRVNNYIKAAVEAASTDNQQWAGNLIHEGNIVADFVEYLRPQTILGQLESSLRKVPAGVPIDIQTSGGSAQWVGEGKAKPLTKWSYDTTKLEEYKVATIAVITEELLRKSSRAADVMLRDELARAIAARLDTDFIDPAKALVSGISPASITNGASNQASAGIDADINYLIGQIITAGLSVSGVTIVMNSANAFALTRMRDALGNRVYPDMSLNGGKIDGLEVVVSDYAGAIVAALIPSEIYLVDEGGLQLDMSDQASLEMADNPAANSTTPTAAQLVSMWQTNSVAFRAERFINWSRRRAAAVAYVTAADYSQDPDNG